MTVPVVLRLGYFYAGDPAADLDNIIKPIQDSLQGLVYADDIQVVDLVASSRPIAGNYHIPDSPLLAQAVLSASADFVWVEVRESTNVEVLRL